MNEKPNQLIPTTLKREGDDFLAITWNDGHVSRISWKHLRANCPCANCKEEKLKQPDPFRVLKPSELIAPAPVAMVPVGHYAYRIGWTDGHDTGIFTLENLRSLCQCPDCVQKAQATNR